MGGGGVYFYFVKDRHNTTQHYTNTTQHNTLSYRKIQSPLPLARKTRKQKTKTHQNKGTVEHKKREQKTRINFL
jgi:hypothetical protein